MILKRIVGVLARSRAGRLAGLYSTCRSSHEEVFTRGLTLPRRQLNRTMSTEMGKSPWMSVKPSRGLMDEMFQIVIVNLMPNQEVTLHSLHQSEDKDYWEAFGHYISDEHGTVTVAKDESLGGTYEGTEPMGLLWSMRPVPGSRSGLRLRKRDVLSPMVVHISVYDGLLSQDFRNQTALATRVAERWYIAPDVERVDIREKEIRATLFLPPGPGPHPGVLDLWGAGAGLVEYRAALLASHGFVSLALDYLAPNELRLTDVDASFSYFEEAYQILQNHPKVQGDRLAMLGLSFGGAATLSLVAYSKIIKPKCCICINASHVLSIDKPLSKFFEDTKANVYKLYIKEDGQLIHRDHVLPLPTDKNLKVDVGRIKCPLLFVAGSDDQHLPTIELAEDMKDMMEKAGNQHLIEILLYPGAGHLIDPPYTPNSYACNFILHGKSFVLRWGGQTKPHAYAQEDAWKRILAFLQQHLHFSSV